MLDACTVRRLRLESSLDSVVLIRADGPCFGGWIGVGDQSGEPGVFWAELVLCFRLPWLYPSTRSLGAAHGPPLSVSRSQSTRLFSLRRARWRAPSCVSRRCELNFTRNELARRLNTLRAMATTMGWLKRTSRKVSPIDLLPGLSLRRARATKVSRMLARNFGSMREPV